MYNRSLDYTINGYYKNHVTVFAEVVPVSLELSTDHLIVEPQVGLPADAGQNCLPFLPVNHVNKYLIIYSISVL